MAPKPQPPKSKPPKPQPPKPQPPKIQIPKIQIPKINVRSRIERIKAQNIRLRGELFPRITEEMIWDKAKRGGYWTIPRILPYLHKIMDELSSGEPLHKAYFALWCRSFEDMLIRIKNEQELAFESGFERQRGLYLWRDRMRLLTDLGFIASAAGRHMFSYVQIICPIFAVEELRKKGKVSDGNYNAFKERLLEIEKAPEDQEPGGGA